MNMKHYCLIPGLLLPAILMMSCARIQTEATDSPEHGMSGPDGGSVTIAASITEPASSIIPSTAIAHTGNIPDSAGSSTLDCIGDGTDTKTYVGSVKNGIYKLYWSTGDKISVNGTTSNALDESAAGSGSAKFTVEGVSAPYSIIYPAEARRSESEITFLTNQTHIQGSFPEGSSIMAGKSETEAVSLYHVGGFLKLSVLRDESDGDDIAEIIVKGNASEAISGTFQLSYDAAGKPVVGEAVSGADHVSLTSCNQSGEYLIALPPISFASGITVEIIDAKNHFMRIKTGDSFSIKPGIVTCSPDITFRPTGTHIGAGIEQKDFQVSWDRDNAQSWAGGYGRVHRLNDGRLMAVYEAHVCNGYCRFSEDNGLTWTEEALALPKAKHTVNGETVWSNIANSEFAQLSHTHPHHPDRIIYAGNIRPSGTRSDLMPYSICYVTSDDGGSSWSKRKIIYESNTWSTAIAKGCWEPFVLELPDGTVQIYFADETPYYRLGLGYQNISVIESKDGGDSWGEARIAAYTVRYRDGMPVVMLYDGNIYLAIEHYEGSGQHLRPQIVYTSVEDNWSTVIYGSDSEHRFDPMQKALDYVNNYYGAPYLIETDDFFVLSYQSSEGASKPSADNSVMEVVVSPKSEFMDRRFTTMRTPTRPVTVDQSTGKARWNSLCDLGNNEVLAVSDLGGTLVLTRGKIDK